MSNAAHIKVAEFFVIPRRRIISNDRFKLANALAARKSLEGLTKQSNIRNSLGENVYERAERTEKEDHVNPVDVRSSPDEVDDRKPLEQQAPREEKMAQKSHAVVIQRQLNILLSSSRAGLNGGIYVEIIIQDDVKHIWRRKKITGGFDV